MGDSGGEAVVAGAREDWRDSPVTGDWRDWRDRRLERRIVLIWDLRLLSTGSSRPRELHGVPVPVACVWLDVAADRTAAGCVDGTVQIWSFYEGRPLARCTATILESTRWTMAGHREPLCCLGSAEDSNCVISLDREGVICAWSDDGVCQMCSHAGYE